MKKSWSTLKQIIRDSRAGKELFLSLIDNSGHIRSANQQMLRGLELTDPRQDPVNFMDLVHPVNLGELQKLLSQAKQRGNSFEIELYIRNGHYHPMKWQFNPLVDSQGEISTYFCLGYRLLDEQRLHRFNSLVKNHCQLIIEGLSGVLFQDVHGEIIAANQKLASMFDTTLERLYQVQNVAQLWDSQWMIEDEEGHAIPYQESPFRLAQKSGVAQRKILVVSLPNGRKHWLLFNSQILAEEEHNGQFAVVSSIVDLTKERELLSELKDREHLMKAFLQNTPNLAWIVDDDETLLFASQAFLDYFHLNEKESIGKKISRLLPSNIVLSLYSHHLEVLDTGKPIKTTQQLELASGENIVSHINIFPIDMPSGKRLMGGQAVSIPDKSKLEKELHKVQQRLWTLSRATSDAIWEWDMQTGQIFRNETLMEMIGYQVDNSRGLSWWLRRVHPEDRNRVADKVKEATDNLQQSWQDSYRFKCSDGHYKYIQDRGFVVYENGLPVKMIGSLQDISAVKELETRLNDERLQLQKSISETVIEVAENERTRIGHELHDNVNQILSTAKLFVDMIATSSPDQQVLKDKSNDYLAMAIEEIRKLSRDLVAPQLKEEKLVDSIRLLVEDIEMAQEMEIRFSPSPDAEKLSQGKKVTLFRIVQEQLKNIIKHSQASRTDINLDYTGDSIRLRIVDNGQGFDPRQTHRGIGLSNIYERTKFYNGTVDVDAAPGRGCSITVTIPLGD